jgi:mRNA-degrading endonuclease toxin of MazEF toxin-antitoxin module
VIVIPFTSIDNAEIDTRVAVSPSPQNGLDRNCFLEVDKMSAISSSYVGNCIGRLENLLMKEAHSMAVKLISRSKT